MGPWDATLLIWKLQHKTSSLYALQHFSVFAKLVIADFEKKRRLNVLLRSGGVSGTLNLLQAG